MKRITATILILTRRHSTGHAALSTEIVKKSMCQVAAVVMETTHLLKANLKTFILVNVELNKVSLTGEVMSF